MSDTTWIAFSIAGLYVVGVLYLCYKSKGDGEVPPTYTPPTHRPSSKQEYDRMIQEHLIREIRDNTKK